MAVLRLELSLKNNQMTVFQSDRRFKIVVAGRRWGKTFLAVWSLIVNAFGGCDRIGYYIAPTYGQAKRVAWDVLLRLIPPGARVRVLQDELRIVLCNGSVIQLHGADRADSLRGVGLNYVVVDELAYMDGSTWPRVIRPLLSDRQGRALLISTPAGRGPFYDFFNDARADPDWAAFHFTTSDGGYVSADELNRLKRQMTAKEYSQEFEARFETLASRVYYAFDDELNVTDLERVPYQPLLVGMDFNVNPMTAVITQKVGDQCHVIDEIVLPNSNTPEMMAELRRRYPDSHGVVQPDPTGDARKTSAPVGKTDFCIIEEAGWPVYKTKTYPLVDRLNTVNARLCNASGDRRILISPKCRHLIRSLGGLTYKEGTKIPDKSSGLDHIADALGYLIMGVFPIVKDNEVTIEQVLI